MEPASFEPQTKPVPSHKKLFIIVASVVLLIVIGLIAFFMMQPKSNSQQSSAPQSQVIEKAYGISAQETPISYADTSIYDACNLISFQTLRKNIDGYQAMLDTIGTDKRPTDPLVIEHGYVDRNIPAALGKDAQPRQKGTTIGGSGGSDGISAYMLPSDSNCWYGQGEGISLGRGTTFVKTYVIQKPTPIAGDLLAYINSLKPVVSEKGIDVYVEPGRDSGNFATVFAVNQPKTTVAIFKTGSAKIADSASADLIAALSKEPKGPMSIVYPKPWNDMPDPCKLITADDFLRYTGKPASAVAEDSIYLTDVGDGHMKRTCSRLEVERLKEGEISESKVEVRVAKSEKEAENYVRGLKAREEDDITIEPLAQNISGANESFIKIKGYTKKRFALEMRIGAKIVAVTILGEAGQEESTQTYSERMRPIGAHIASQLKR